MNFASEEAQVTFDDSKTSIADIIAIIQKTGYGAQEKTDELPQAAPEAHIGWRLWLLFAINIPFLIGMAGMLVGRNDWMIPSCRRKRNIATSSRASRSIFIRTTAPMKDAACV